jgi:hypothetical protein
MIIRTPAVVLPRDVVTDRPPSAPPAMRLHHIVGAAETELPWTTRRTPSGGVVFAGFEVYERNPPAAARTYRLVVRPDRALRPEQPDGYLFTVPADFAVWPVTVAVTLLPGPAYPYLPQTPVLHGRILRAGGAPVPDTEVAVLLDGGRITARGLTDDKGRFSVGVPHRRTGRNLTLRAAGARHQLTDADFDRPVNLTVP